MKWFQHYSDAYTDLKIQDLIDDFGMEGYGFYWLCCELIAQQGKNYRLKDEKKWKKALERNSRIEIKKIETILNHFASVDLISKKSLNKGILHILKMAKYSDDYTKRVRRVFGQGSVNVRQDKIRLDKNILEKKRRPFFKYFPMRKTDTGWYVIDKGQWKQFAGDPEKDIEWR